MNAVKVIATERNTFRTGSPLVLVFTSEASTLGLPPGCWPREVETTLGNKQPFTLVRIEYGREDEVTGALYDQHLGCTTLRILND